MLCVCVVYVVRFLMKYENRRVFCLVRVVCVVCDVRSLMKYDTFHVVCLVLQIVVGSVL